jgi:hypothetical protein
MYDTKEVGELKKWNKAELISIDIDMTESGGNPSKEEKWKHNRWQGAGHPGQTPDNNANQHLDGNENSDSVIDATS